MGHPGHLLLELAVGWPAPGLAIAFAAFAIWAVWVSPRRRMSMAVVVLYLGVVAWWISISPSHDRNGGRKSR